jgi:hypothetical protein
MVPMLDHYIRAQEQLAYNFRAQLYSLPLLTVAYMHYVHVSL